MEHPLRELRLSLGMRQRPFADEVDLHPTYVSQIETGHQPMGKESALKVGARFRAEMVQLGITIEDLMRGTRERPSGKAEPGEGLPSGSEVSAA